MRSLVGEDDMGAEIRSARLTLRLEHRPFVVRCEASSNGRQEEEKEKEGEDRDVRREDEKMEEEGDDRVA
ncbi:hypothetical protein YC2023_041447 [Brassica napus]